LWVLKLDDSGLQREFESLPDLVRWQLINLVLTDASPMLWFFLTKSESGKSDSYQYKIDEKFLDHVFVRAGTALRNFVRGRQGLDYKLANTSVPYPLKPASGSVVGRIVASVDGKKTMREVMAGQGIVLPNKESLTEIRIKSTTSMYPLLQAIS